MNSCVIMCASRLQGPQSAAHSLSNLALSMQRAGEMGIAIAAVLKPVFYKVNSANKRVLPLAYKNKP